MYLAIAILLCFPTSGRSEKNILLKFKSDVDQVGKDFNTLIFDIVKKVVDNISVYQVNGDYYSSDEELSEEEPTTQHSVAKKVLDSTVENTTEEYVTEKTVKVKSTNMRLKRSVNENASTSIAVREKHKTLNNTDLCTEKSSNEQILELQHIEDLKEEIKKLHDLVILLRDQQKLISLLDKNSDNLYGDMSSRFDTKDLIKILDYVNSRDIHERRDRYPLPDKEHNEKISTHEELANIKTQLREAIETLNKTRDVLTTEKKRELLLERELSDQKLDINFLKMMMRKLYRSSIDLPSKENVQDDVLGAVPHLPKPLPEPTTAKATEEVEKTQEEKSEPISDKAKLESKHDVKAVPDLKQLLRRLNQPKKSEAELRMSEMPREKSKKIPENNEEELMQQLRSLENFLEQRKDDIPASTDSDVIKRLRHALRLADEEKTRALDDNIDVELQKLQQVIDGLKQKDEETESDFNKFAAALNKLLNQDKVKEEEEKREKFQAMLNKMLRQESKKEDEPSKQFETLLNQLANQGKRDDVRSGPGVNGQDRFLKEIIELRKQLASLEKPRSFFPVEYGYGPESPGVYGKQPYQPEFPPNSYGHATANHYPSHLNPKYQNTMNPNLNTGDIPIGPNNQYSRNYSPSPNYYNTPPSAKIYPYLFKSVPRLYEGDFNQNQAYPENKVYSYEAPSQYSYNFERNMNSNPHPISFEAHTSEPYPLDLYPHQNQPYSFNQLPYKHNPELNPQPNPFESYPPVPLPPSFGPEPYQKVSNMDPPPASSFAKQSVPYNQIVTDNQPQDEMRNKFFPAAPIPNTYTRPIPESFYSSQEASGHSGYQQGTYPQKTGNTADYIYQKVEDLKNQIYNLQNIIDGFNKPNYTKTPEDRETVFSLEKQINELKDIINSMSPDPGVSSYTPNNPSSNVDPSNSPQVQQPHQSSNNHIKRRSLNDDSRLYNDVVSGLKQLIFDKNDPATRSTYDDVQRRINDLKYQLGAKKEHQVPPSYAYQPPYHEQNAHFTPPKIFEISKSKKNDVFTSIVIKILDKIIAATPAVLEKLFGSSIAELSNFGDYSRDGYDYSVGGKDQSDIQVLFKNLGFFGYAPLILLKLIDGFTTFLKILKKNALFKNFIIPGLIVMAIAGGVVFFIWWLQPNAEDKDANWNYPRIGPTSYQNRDNNKYNEPYSNYNYRGNGYGNNNHYYDYEGSYKRPTYYY